MQKFKVFCDQKRDFELINQVNYQGPTQPEPVEGFTDENAPPPAQEAVGMFVCAYEDCNFIQVGSRFTKFKFIVRIQIRVFGTIFHNFHAKINRFHNNFAILRNFIQIFGDAAEIGVQDGDIDINELMDMPMEAFWETMLKKTILKNDSNRIKI